MVRRGRHGTARTRRGSPAVQPATGHSDGSQGRVKPVRVTVDLAPAVYERLREWAFSERMAHAQVLRALVALLDDPAVVERVRRSRNVEDASLRSKKGRKASLS